MAYLEAGESIKETTGLIGNEAYEFWLVEVSGSRGSWGKVYIYIFHYSCKFFLWITGVFADSILAGAPGVLSSPFVHSLNSPLGSPFAGGVAGVPGLNSFQLAQTAPGLRGLPAPGLSMATVLLVSNLNEEVSIITSQ